MYLLFVVVFVITMKMTLAWFGNHEKDYLKALLV